MIFPFCRCCCTTLHTMSIHGSDINHRFVDGNTRYSGVLFHTSFYYFDGTRTADITLVREDNVWKYFDASEYVSSAISRLSSLFPDRKFYVDSIGGYNRYSNSISLNIRVSNA